MGGRVPRHPGLAENVGAFGMNERAVEVAARVETVGERELDGEGGEAFGVLRVAHFEIRCQRKKGRESLHLRTT